MSELLVSFVTAFVLTGSAIPILRRLGTMDVPSRRSSHTLPIPRGGGLAVLVGVAAGCAIAEGAAPWPLVVIAAVVGLVGFVDDVRTLGSPIRLVAQFACAIGAIWWAASFTDRDMALWAVPGVIFVAGYINAFNFMDGINGISGLNALVAGSWYAWVGHDLRIDALVAVGLSIAGASLGFLPWNSPRARIFLGDAGSYGVGLLIAGAAVLSWCAGASILWAIAPLIIYLSDTGWVVVKRAVGGRPLSEAHREHVYQRLVDQGWSHFASAALTAAAAAAIAVIVWQTSSVIAASAIAAITAIYLWAPTLATRVKQGAT